MKRLMIRPDLADDAQLAELLKTLDWDELDRSHLVQRNTRNAVYTFAAPGLGCDVMLKRSRPSPRYAPHRVFDFYLRQFFKHYGRHGFDGAELLCRAGFATIEPIASWKHRVAPLRYESCFLYRRLEADFSVRDFMESRFDETSPEHRRLLPLLFAGMVRLTRRLHDAGILHGDLVPNNFLVRLDGGPEPSPAFMLIDTDHVVRNRMPGRFLKRVLALRCLKRISFDPATRDLFLRLYLGADYRPFWGRVLEYWRWRDGGPFSKGLKQLLRLRRPTAWGRRPEKPVTERLGRAQRFLLECFATTPSERPL